MRRSFVYLAKSVFLVSMFLIFSCAPHLSQQKIDEKKASQITQVHQTPPPIPPQMGIPPQVEIDPDKGITYSFSALDMTLEDVLDVFSKQAGFSVIWDKDVNTRTRISVKFDDLTLTEALDAIFTPTEYLYTTNSPSVHVKLLDTRDFELGKIPFKITTNIQAGGNILGSIPNTGGMSGQFQLTGTTDADAVDIWTQAEVGIKNMLSPDGKYAINELAGVVTVTDRKNNLKLVGDYIRKLNESLNRQVMIEAEVVEVTLEQTQSWGINWSAVHSFLLNDKTINITGNQSLGLPGSVVQFTASRNDFDVILDILGRFGEVNVLSKPRLSVMNGQTALINVGKVLSYWELTGIASGTEVGQAVVYPTQKTVMLGLTMGVTPYISSDDHVVMQVLPIVSDANTWSEFQYQDQTLKAPNLEIRETSTQVRLKNGETVVIGGLITSKKTNSENKIPILGDIPLLGYFFKRIEKIEQRSELVIFLTPWITKTDRGEG
jgi:MSHA biogenesis protein MshL